MKHVPAESVAVPCNPQVPADPPVVHVVGEDVVVDADRAVVRIPANALFQSALVVFAGATILAGAIVSSTPQATTDPRDVRVLQVRLDRVEVELGICQGRLSDLAAEVRR